MQNKKKFFFTETVNIGYVEIETYFEVEENEIHSLQKMTKSEFKEFLQKKASYKIVDASKAQISIVDFEKFEEESLL
jgi:hypothetical protein